MFYRFVSQELKMSFEIGLPDQWDVIPVGCQTNGRSDEWAAGPVGCRIM